VDFYRGMVAWYRSPGIVLTPFEIFTYKKFVKVAGRFVKDINNIITIWNEDENLGL
jgi:hypothetical protein